MTGEEERKQIGELIISLAIKISKLERKIIDITKWASTQQNDLVKGLWEILDKK